MTIEIETESESLPTEVERRARPARTLFFVLSEDRKAVESKRLEESAEKCAELAGVDVSRVVQVDKPVLGDVDVAVVDGQTTFTPKARATHRDPMAAEETLDLIDKVRHGTATQSETVRLALILCGVKLAVDLSPIEEPGGGGS